MTSQPTPLYCANHPTTETTLRCNRCEKPICAKCAILTPTGYRCKDCVRSQQKTFDSAIWYDYILAIIVGGVLSYLGGRLASRIGFFIIFLAPIAGMVIAEAVRFVIRRRRSARLFQISAVAAAIGAFFPILPYLLAFLFGIFQGEIRGLGFLLPLVYQGVYLFLVTSTVYYRLRGIRV